MEQTAKTNADLFSRINGGPAHILIIAGLVLVLAAPLIPTFKSARVARAQAEFNQIDALMELDLEDLRRSHERERKGELEAAQREISAPVDLAAMPPEQIEKVQAERRQKEQARQAREQERQKAFDDKKEDLKKKYDSLTRKRELLNAQIGTSGMHWHYVVGFLGNAMLLIGLLVVTLESDGVKQKVALIILLVTMFSALSGVNLNFAALGTMGDRSPNLDRVFKP